MADARLVIEGLSDFRRDLRRASKDAPKALQKANKAVAERVTPAVQAAYSARYTTRSGRGRRGIRAVATQTSAGIRIGGARVPYLIGQEFGSLRFRQFFPWTGKQGRFLYPTIRGLSSEITDIYWDEMDKAFANPFPLKGFAA